jgi:hypothetical protein
MKTNFSRANNISMQMLKSADTVKWMIEEIEDRKKHALQVTGCIPRKGRNFAVDPGYIELADYHIDCDR